MEILRFKTNINCASCVSNVTPVLTELLAESGWKVDTAAPDKILTVHTETVSAATIIAALQKVGYTAVLL